MTKEPIMIDEIDVAECEFCEEEKYCNIYPFTCDFNDYCKSNTDCFVKKLLLKLKRKEQECEAYKMEAEEGKEINAELKAENEKLKQYKASKQASYESMQREWNEAKNEIKQLKAENEELKETISDKEKWLSEIEIKNSEYWKEKYADLHIRYGNRIEEYKQALQEIKEIAEYDFKERMNAEDYHNMTEVLQQILQKCEVINEE